MVQRFLHEEKLIVPFKERAKVGCRDYSTLLERAVVDFAADSSFGQASEKRMEHYGISVSPSRVQNVTKKHAKAVYEMQEQEAEMVGESRGVILIAEMDGGMVPVVSFESGKHPEDNRKCRKVGWKEARLSVAREHKSLRKMFLGALGSIDGGGRFAGALRKATGL